MRHNLAVLAVVVCLLPVVASAATVTSVSPAKISFGNVEEFLTIGGSGLQGTESVRITISGPAGTFVLEPSSLEPERIVTWVPEVILLSVGVHSVTVAVKNVGEPVQTLGPLAFSVEVIETFGPPLLNLPEPLAANAENSDGARVRFNVSARSQNGATANVTCDRESGDLFPFGSTYVTCSARDEFGIATDGFSVFVGDFTPPVLTLPADITSGTPVVEYVVSATDNIDGAVPVSCTKASGSAFPAGVTEVICIAYDAQFNPAIGVFFVTVGGAPILTLPADIKAEATSASGAAVSYAVTATEDAIVSCTPASGSTFPIGTTAVVCTARAATASVSGTFNVTVRDTTAPLLALPPNSINEATGPDGAAVTYVASATDLVDGSVSVSCVPASGTTFPLGATLVSCSASDALGNSAYGTFEVRVVDRVPPQILNATASPDLIWPPDHRMVPVTVTVSAYDAVDLAPVARIISVTSNQPQNGTGDGDTAPDWSITGSLTVNVRAERAASADRVYTITVEVTDAVGNSSLRDVAVRVSQTSRRRSSR